MLGSYITFDYDNGTKELYSSLLPEGDFIELTPADPLNAEENESHVFDFGGYLDSKIIQTAKVCDQCVVPISYQSPAELKPFVDTVKELEKHNKNIIILINATDREYVEDLELALRKQFKHPIFVIPKSKFISKLSVYKETPIELYLSDKIVSIQKHHLKKLSPLFIAFYNYLSKSKKS